MLTPWPGTARYPLVAVYYPGTDLIIWQDSLENLLFSASAVELSARADQGESHLYFRRLLEAQTAQNGVRKSLFCKILAWTALRRCLPGANEVLTLIDQVAGQQASPNPIALRR